MLRHIGVTRRQILGMLAVEGGLLTRSASRRLRAGLVHQPDSGLRGESAVVPLDHAVAPAMERTDGSCWRCWSRHR